MVACGSGGKPWFPWRTDASAGSASSACFVSPIVRRAARSRVRLNEPALSLKPRASDAPAVSANVRRKPHLIARRAVHHCVIGVAIPNDREPRHDDPHECTPRQEVHQLSEQGLAGVHGRVLPGNYWGERRPFKAQRTGRQWVHRPHGVHVYRRHRVVCCCPLNQTPESRITQPPSLPRFHRGPAGGRVGCRTEGQCILP